MSLSSFNPFALTRSEMKNVVGGDGFRCWCSGAMSSCFTAPDKQAAYYICSEMVHGGGPECYVSSC